MIEVCLPSQSWSEKHNQEKSPQTFAPFVNISNMCQSCFIIIKPCNFDYGINKHMTYSRCLICVAWYVYVISTYYVRKGSQAFLSWLPTNQRGQKSDHIVVFPISKIVTLQMALTATSQSSAPCPWTTESSPLSKRKEVVDVKRWRTLKWSS